MTTPIAIKAGDRGRSANVRLGIGAWAWISFEAARIPALLLVSSFVFVPYFVTTLVGSPVKGQELIAFVTTWMGLIVALVSPILGASVDRWGSRKPLLAPLVILQIGLLASLWWARPGGAGLSVPEILVVLGASTALAGISEMLFNSMMPRAVGRQAAAKASGYALTIANVVGVLALIVVLWAFELPGKMSAAFIPAHPLLGLDPAQAEPARIVGPFAAVIYAVCALPLFLFTPDSPRTNSSFRAALSGGLNDLRTLLKEATSTRQNVIVYLLSRMAFYDAIAAYVTFSGIYAAGVMGWRGPEMLIFGIGSAISCGTGAFLAQMLDRTAGPRRALIAELSILFLVIVGEVGMAPDRIFYIPYETRTPLWRAPLFQHPNDLVFMALAFVAAATLVGATASARTLLVHLTPANQAGAIFGLAGLSNSATNWLAPMLIGLFTAFWGTQQAGFLALLILLAAGIFGLFFVRDEPATAIARA